MVEIINCQKKRLVSYLETRYKVSCLRVCQERCRGISNSDLFQELRFNNDGNKLNQAFTVFDENEQLGKQVTDLTLMQPGSVHHTNFAKTFTQYQAS
jgi:hypothetical protein